MKLTRKGSFIIGLLLLLVVASAGAAYYYLSILKGGGKSSANNDTTDTPVISPAVTDAELRSSLLQEIIKRTEWRKHAIEVEVVNGMVTLRGAVETEVDRRALEQMVRSRKGVKALTISLELKPAQPPPTTIATSASNIPESVDERLAKEVEFACYKTDAFNLREIQISAQEGKVKLAGKVRSRAEKLLAERIAKEVNGVKEVINQLELAEGER